LLKHLLRFGTPARQGHSWNDGMRNMMPKNIGQWTGMMVTTIIVLGCDMDVVYAMPLGIMAGALATFFVTLADRHDAVRAK
jgi:hypothetical protein